MSVAVSQLACVRPSSLEHALDLLADDPALVPLAGCTDLYVDLHFGKPSGHRFIDLTPLRELRRIDRLPKGGGLFLGALSTHTDLVRSALVRAQLSALAQAASEIGGAQIQNRGTLGGNIVNASSAGDTLPVLLAANARFILGSRAGVRRVMAADFFTGYRQTLRRADELLLGVEVPPVDGPSTFLKVGTRAAQAISKVVLAVVRGPTTAIAVGSVGPTVVRLPRTEARVDSGAKWSEVEETLQSEIKPIDDIRSTAAYRRSVTARALRRMLSDLSFGSP